MLGTLLDWFGKDLNLANACIRPLNPFLMIAIIALPVPLVLGLLWPGHARSTRVAGFVYAGAHVLLAAVALVVGLGE